MEKAQENGMKLFDEEIKNYKNKKSETEQLFTELRIEHELLKEKCYRMVN